MSAWADEYMTLIEDCEHRSERLTDWEAQFIDSIKHQITEGRRLSTKQTERLDEVWEKATAKG
jgi:hypothetical protein